ncbi:hypothetical protein D3C81_877090 [compost metagenome]
MLQQPGERGFGLLDFLQSLFLYVQIFEHPQVHQRANQLLRYAVVQFAGNPLTFVFLGLNDALHHRVLIEQLLRHKLIRQIAQGKHPDARRRIYGLKAGGERHHTFGFRLQIELEGAEVLLRVGQIAI